MILPASGESSKDALYAAGTTAIARIKPTNSVADVATFLAETISSGLPRMIGSSLWKEQIRAGRDAGDEYLNLEFGWKPLISDIREILAGIAHAKTVLEQYERSSGSVVRRRYDFPVIYSETRSDVAGGSVVFQDHPTFHTPQRAAGTEVTTKTRKKVWFSGAFTYHLPTGFHSRNALVRLGAQASALLGTDFSPETLWNAAPWSWAVDWFSNAGDVVSNYSAWATDGLVLRYGYVMEHCSVTSTYNAVVKAPPASKAEKDAVIMGTPVQASVETKQRVVATPFGFGLSDSVLTDRQLAIIGALGLSRGKR